MVLPRFSTSPPSARFVQIPCRIGFHVDGWPAKNLSALPFCPRVQVQPFPHKISRPAQYGSSTRMYYLTLEESLHIRKIFFGRLDPILPLITALQASGVKKGSLEISVISWPRARPVFCFFRETASWFEIHSQLSVVWFRRRRAGKAREQQPEFQSEATARWRFRGKKKLD